MAQTAIEKIVQRFAVGFDGDVHAGDFVTIRPRHVMTHDNTGAVIPKFKEIAAPRVHDPRQPVFILDHDIQNKSEKNLAKYATIEAFAKEHGIDFYPAGSGIGHQVMMEQGYVAPGSLVVASDSHSNMYGAACCVGTPVVRTDAAVIWATGTFWWEVPPVVKVALEGKLPAGSTGKDVIVTLCGLYNADEVLNCAIEFVGDGVARLSMDERMTISNMTTEWGALVGMFPCDSVTMEYARARPRITAQAAKEIESLDLVPDKNAYYAKTLHLDLASVTPHVSGPNEVKVMKSVAEIEKERVKIQKAYLVSCVNSRTSDIEAAARVLEGKKVADGVELYVAAASAGVEAEAQKSGAWATLEMAGAHFLPAGCGPCIGLGTGLLEPGEVGISATNRNFKGRMGSKEAFAYLASPAVVAASAAAGYICGPQKVDGRKLEKRIEEHHRAAAKGVVKIIEGFPKVVRGEAIFLPKDNMNTDSIYAGQYTYKDDMKPDEMAAVIFSNYDENFRNVARPGDILVGGSNFGTGSSREQAATALKFFGIPLLIAETFSQTYKRNAFNNGFMCMECPELVNALRKEFASRKDPTIRTGWNLEVDFTQSKVRLASTGAEFSITPFRETAQSLIVAGGAEAQARRQLQCSESRS